MYEIIRSTYYYKDVYDDFLQQFTTVSELLEEDSIERLPSEQKARKRCNQLSKEASDRPEESKVFFRFSYRKAE